MVGARRVFECQRDSLAWFENNGVWLRFEDQRQHQLLIEVFGRILVLAEGAHRVSNAFDTFGKAVLNAARGLVIARFTISERSGADHYQAGTVRSQHRGTPFRSPEEGL
jgi:hypothetical protein